MCFDESFLWLYVHCEIWYDEKHVPCNTMGGGEYLLFAIGNFFFPIFVPGGTEDQYLDLLERLGVSSDARRMDGMVGSKQIISTCSRI